MLKRLVCWKALFRWSKFIKIQLGRILRYLSTLHVYREVKPDVFTNNRVSGAMDTGKEVAEILEECVNKIHTLDGLH
jgi:hypothetical protein